MQSEVYFDKFIGINVPQGKPEKIVLRFKNNTGKYMLTQPIHGSQKLINNNGDTHDFKYLLAVNQEFIGVLLSWGESVEVLEPKEFREQLKATLEKSLKAYTAD